MSAPYSSLQIALILLSGGAGGAVTVLVARAFSRSARPILAAVLVVAAVFYVAFAARAGAGSAWIAAEVLGVLLYGGLGLAGVRGSPWWLAAGWALHPVWDIALHYVGPGHAFTPEPYAIACLSWDLVVAGYVAYCAVRGSRSTAAAASVRPS